MVFEAGSEQIVMGTTRPGLPFSTGGGTYQVAGAFIFPGVSEIGLKEVIKVIAYKGTDGSGAGSVMIYDYTNSQIIAEKNGIGQGIAIHDLGAVSNLPIGEAVFEIQIKLDSGTGTFTAASGQMQRK